MKIKIDDILIYLYNPEDLKPAKKHFLDLYFGSDEDFFRFITDEKRLNKLLQEPVDSLLSKPPLKLKLTSTVYNRSYGKVIMAAADSHLKTPLQTLASFYSEEYNFIIRVALDHNSNTFRISGITDNNLVNFENCRITFNTYLTSFFLDRFGKCTSPVDEQIQDIDWEQTNIEITFPIDSIDIQNEQHEDRNFDFKIEENEDGFFLQLIKNKVWLPDAKKIRIEFNTQASTTLAINNNSTFITDPKKNITKISLYS